MSESGDDIVREFLVESYENLDQLDRDFVSLEQDPTSRELLGRVFRTIHTIKGTCGFLGFQRLEAVTHAGESLLSDLREGTQRLNPELTTTLLRLVDAVREILSRIESGGAEGEERYLDLIAELERLHSRVKSKPVDPRMLSDFAPPAAAPATRDPLLETPHREDATATSVADGSVRVDVQLLDRLVTLVSELVLARNQILQHVSSRDHAALPATSQRLDLITSELQEGIMKTRMQPIGHLWSKLPRQARDVAAACGKEVRLEMEGAETELDKTVLEAIRDPLTHLLRNAIDHGIESREIRLACGKNPEGRVLLRAFHESGQVHIEISDDGAGLPIERIKRKALERNLVASERAARMTDREWAGLIFTPGFSTAQAVTAISGRGVGMDVVKTDIERIGGRVDVHSQGAIGTTIFLKLPLTLAIVPALIVTDDGERFAIPQASLREVLRFAPTQTSRAVEWAHHAPVYRLRGRLLPLVFLRELLNERRPFGPGSLETREGCALHVVVLDANGREFGLVVDAVNDAEEIVVKPLIESLQGTGALAGTTILGDGRVSLILDVPGVARSVGLAGPGDGRTSEPEPEPGSARSAVAPREPARTPTALLVAEARTGWRVAFPLARVARLEEFERSAIERSGERDVVQYRGGIVRLVRLARLLDPQAPDEPWQRRVPVVLLEAGAHRLALTVSSLVDIVEERLEPEPVPGRAGIAAAVVVRGRVVDLLDLDAILGLATVEADLAMGAGT